MAKTRCEVEEFEDAIPSQYGDAPIYIPSVRARCSRCGHTTESGGAEERSITRCLVLMREQCPRGERHYYTTDPPKAPRRYREGEPLEVNVAVNTGGVLVVPADISVEDYIRQKQEAGEIEPMRDVTPRPRSLMPEPIEHLPEAPVPSPEPAPRRTPTETRITRGD